MYNIYIYIHMYIYIYICIAKPCYSQLKKSAKDFSLKRASKKTAMGKVD